MLQRILQTGKREVYLDVIKLDEKGGADNILKRKEQPHNSKEILLKNIGAR